MFKLFPDETVSGWPYLFGFLVFVSIAGAVGTDNGTITYYISSAIGFASGAVFSIYGIFFVSRMARGQPLGSVDWSTDMRVYRAFVAIMAIVGICNLFAKDPAVQALEKDGYKQIQVSDLHEFQQVEVRNFSAVDSKGNAAQGLVSYDGRKILQACLTETPICKDWPLNKTNLGNPPLVTPHFWLRFQFLLH